MKTKLRGSGGRPTLSSMAGRLYNGICDSEPPRAYLLFSETLSFFSYCLLACSYFSPITPFPTFSYIFLRLLQLFCEFQCFLMFLDFYCKQIVKRLDRDIVFPDLFFKLSVILGSLQVSKTTTNSRLKNPRLSQNVVPESTACLGNLVFR